MRSCTYERDVISARIGVQVCWVDRIIGRSITEIPKPAVDGSIKCAGVVGY